MAPEVAGEVALDRLTMADDVEHLIQALEIVRKSRIWTEETVLILNHICALEPLLQQEMAILRRP